MSKRYYLCGIVGDGSSPENAQRPAIRDDLGPGDSLEVVYPPADPNTGLYPPGSTCLVIVGKRNHAPLVAKQGVDALPDVALDVKLSAVHKPTRDAMKARILARGLAFDEAGLDGYREVIRSLGRQISGSSTWNENAFDVPDAT